MKILRRFVERWQDYEEEIDRTEGFILVDIMKGGY